KTTLTPGCRGVALTETIKHLSKKLRCDSLACVRHGNFYVRVNLFNTDMNATASRREFDRVGQKVPDDLLETILVCDNNTMQVCKRRRKPDRLGFSGGGSSFDTGAYYCRQIHLLQVQSHLTGIDSAPFEQVLDHLRLRAVGA